MLMNFLLLFLRGRIKQEEEEVQMEKAGRWHGPPLAGRWQDGGRTVALLDPSDIGAPLIEDVPRCGEII